jgi:hypothetical protein
MGSNGGRSPADSLRAALTPEGTHSRMGHLLQVTTAGGRTPPLSFPSKPAKTPCREEGNQRVG